MKVLVISGFLGAGKTTFIKMLAETTKRDFVVLENEYGDVDIDSASLRMDTNLDIYELTQGCVCCSMKQDFATSILTISNTLDPEFLIVEPTGVAKLSNILNNIKKIQYEKIVLLKPITIVDGNNFDIHKNEYREFFLDQLDTASKILVSKMENASVEELEDIEKRLTKQSDYAEVVSTHYSKLESSWWESLLDDYLDPSYETKEVAEAEIDLETISLTDISLDSPSKLIAFLEAVTFGVFGQIVRGKGFLPCGDSMLRFDIVNQTYAITGMDEGFIEEAHNIPSCVFIGKDLQRGWIREILQANHYQNRK